MPHPDKPVKSTKILKEHTLKGSIHWFEFKKNNKAKTIDDIHPCLIIGRDNPNSARVIISPISDADNYVIDNEPKYPFHVLLKKDKYNFLDKNSVVLLDQVLTIPKAWLFEEWYMGKIENTRKVDEAIMENYDLIQTVTDLLHEMIDKVALNGRKEA